MYDETTSIETADLSGMGGGYEAQCQRMLWDGVRFLLEHPSAEPRFHATNAFGGMQPLNEDGESLKAAMLASDDTATGGMLQCATGPALMVGVLGHQGWLAAIREADPTRRFYVYTYPGKLELPEGPIFSART